MDLIKNKVKEDAFNKFSDLYQNHKDQPDKIWEALLEYRRLLGNNEYI